MHAENVESKRFAYQKHANHFHSMMKWNFGWLLSAFPISACIFAYDCESLRIVRGRKERKVEINFVCVRRCMNAFTYPFTN